MSLRKGGGIIRYDGGGGPAGSEMATSRNGDLWGGVRGGFLRSAVGQRRRDAASPARYSRSTGRRCDARPVPATAGAQAGAPGAGDRVGRADGDWAGRADGDRVGGADGN